MAAAAGRPESSSPPSTPNAHTTPRVAGTGEENRSPRIGAPRSLPPWIDSYEARYGNPPEEQLQLLNAPPKPVLPQHNSQPYEPIKRRVSKDGFVDWTDGAPVAAGKMASTVPGLQSILKRKGGAERGRKWDHLRSAEPVIVPGYIAPTTANPWRAFVHSSEYGHLPNEEAEIVPPDMLDKLQPGFNNPVETPRLLEPKRSGRTAALYKRIWRIILRHPLVPLFLRLTVLLTSIIALALAARIYEIEESANVEDDHTAEVLVAIVVDSVAIPYIGYMTWDEYTAKPLGLRPPTQKISLILMDLFFIIFKSISTTLAFETLVRYFSLVSILELRYSQALAAFQIVGLISWTMTLTVNVFRLVQRLGGGEEAAPQ